MKKTEWLKLAESNKTFIELQQAAERHGYVCTRACRTYYGDLQVNLLPKDRYNWDKKNYLCDMYLRTDLDFSDRTSEDILRDYHWEMSTTSYGSLEGEEIEAYVKGILESKAMYDELQNIDLRGLEKQLKEYEDDDEE